MKYIYQNNPNRHLIFTRQNFKFFFFLLSFLVASCLWTSNLEAKSTLSFSALGWPVEYTGNINALKNPAKLVTSENYVRRIDELYPSYWQLGVHLERFSRKHQFTDWARVRLAFKASKKLHPSQPKHRVFAMVLILRAMGINAQLFNTSKGSAPDFRLGIETDIPIYNGVMFMFKEKPFALFDISKGQLLGRQSNYPKGYFIDLNHELNQKCRAIRLVPGYYPKFPERSKKMTRRWKFKNKSFQLSYSINPYLVEYLETYPQLELINYFNYPITQNFHESVLKPLRATIEKNKFSEVEAIEFLMAFHHYAFKHKDDLKTSLGEHTNFIEETLMRKYSDCEDLSVLFAAILQGVLGYDVIGLEYPNHVSVAVHAKHVKPRGNVLSYKGKKYSEADPSYAGSKLGMVQPEFKKRTPNILPIAKLRIVK